MRLSLTPRRLSLIRQLRIVSTAAFQRASKLLTKHRHCYFYISWIFVADSFFHSDSLSYSTFSQCVQPLERTSRIHTSAENCECLKTIPISLQISSIRRRRFCENIRKLDTVFRRINIEFVIWMLCFSTKMVRTYAVGSRIWSHIGPGTWQRIAYTEKRPMQCQVLFLSGPRTKIVLRRLKAILIDA